MTRRAGLAIAGLLILMLGLEVVGDARRRDAATYGQGGGESVCFCITETPTFQMVISSTPSLTATPTDGSTTTPLPTSTPALSATPTKVPVLPSHTPDVTECPGYPMAAYVKGMEYVVTKANRQFIRRVPDSSRSDTIIGYLYRDTPRHVWFTLNGWFSLNRSCTMFVWSGYGELYPEMTD